MNETEESWSKANWKRPLALAAGLAVLGLGVYWLEFSHRPKQEELEELEKRLFTLEDKQVKEVRLDTGEQVYEFRCLDIDKKTCKPGDNAKWEIVSPVKLRGDDSNINALVSSLRHLSINEKISLSEETPEKRKQLLGQYGLDEKKRGAESMRSIRVLTEEGEQMAYFGEKHPINDNFFVVRSSGKKLNLETVFLVPPFVKTNFDHQLTHWRDKKLFTIASSDVTGFDLKHSKAKISGALKDGKWSLKSGGKNVPGDIESVDSLVSAATYLTAVEIPAEKKTSSEAKKLLSGANQVLTLELSTQGKKGKTEELEMTLFQKGKKTDSKIYATVSNLDPLYQLDKSALDRLSKGLKDLRVSKLITSMERYSAKRVELQGESLGKDPIQLEQKDAEWSFATKGDQKLNPETVQFLLDKLSGNRIKDYLQEAKKPAKDAIRVTLGDEKEPRKRQLVFWKSGKTIYARDLQLKKAETYIVDPTLWDAIPKTRKDLTEKKDKQIQQPSGG